MRLGLALLCLLCLTTPAFADSEEDKQALRAMARTFEDAIKQRDLGRFQAVLDPAFKGVVVTGEVVDRTTLKNFWDWAWGLIGPKGTWTVTVNPEPTAFFGDIAVAHGSATDHIVTEGGRQWQFNWNWTAVIRRTAEGWRVVAAQGSMDPLGNVFVRTELRWNRILFGLGGGLVGLLVGAGGVYVMKRRSR
jgi:ketosteroid isomerase-like protein